MSLVWDMEIRDIPPVNDPKGGSPRTPFPPITAPEVGNWQHVNGSSIWRSIATGLGGLLVGMTAAWFTAMQYRGVSQRDIEQIIRDSQTEQEKHLLTRTEMHEYVKEYSPWSFDKQAVISRMAAQDQQLGALQQKIDLATRVIENKIPLKP